MLDLRQIAPSDVPRYNRAAVSRGLFLPCERVKVFTYISGTGATVIESALEEQLNRWLETIEEEIVRVTQSESERHNLGQHVTVCIWYVPHDHVIEV
ncbi:MAG: hypothetical protein Q8K78_07235 [Planctomycetaceae bacterium]|nr:hypothetical protein [Planctomycetaceae bacterium]